MTLRLVVVLLALALLARRFLPRHRITWAAPLVLGAVVLAVRGAAWLLTQDA